MAKVKIDMEVEGVGTSKREWDTRIDDPGAAYLYAVVYDYAVAWTSAKLSGALAELGPDATEADALNAAINALNG